MSTQPSLGGIGIRRADKMYGLTEWWTPGRRIGKLKKIDIMI